MALCDQLVQRLVRDYQGPAGAIHNDFFSLPGAFQLCQCKQNDHFTVGNRRTFWTRTISDQNIEDGTRTRIQFNPSGYSYFHWIGEVDGWWLAKIAIGVVLFSGNGFVISYGVRALTVVGVFMALVFFGVIGYGLFSYEIISTENSHVTMVVLVALGTMMATGVSYPHASYRFTGVKHVNSI